MSESLTIKNGKGFNEAGFLSVDAPNARLEGGGGRGGSFCDLCLYLALKKMGILDFFFCP